MKKLLLTILLTSLSISIPFSAKSLSISPKPPPTLNELPTGVMPLLAEDMTKSNRAEYVPKIKKEAIHLSNSRHNLSATFSQKGMLLKVGNTPFNLELSSIGRGDKTEAIKKIKPRIDGVKVIYKHKEIDRWFINSPMGLEQGFTINEKPKGQGKLKLTFKYSNEYIVEIPEFRIRNNTLNYFHFIDKVRKIKLKYGQIKSWDAKGKEMELAISYNSKTAQVVLIINDAKASYPITVDSLFTNEHKQGGSYEYGSTIVLSGDTLVVGSRGIVYLYQRDSDGRWGSQQKLAASDGARNYIFGSAIALSGDTLAVGANSFLGRNAGAVYLYRRGTDGSWGGEQKLAASYGTVAIALSESTLVVGAYRQYPRNKTGSVYIYKRDSDGNWGSEKKLTSGEDGVDVDSFGKNVALFRDTLVVGDSNLVYLYQRSGDGRWESQQKLTASDGTQGDMFGDAIALSGDILVVGAPGESTKGNNAGALYLYYRGSDGVWGGEQKLTASDGVARDWFGITAALSGNILVVGAYEGYVDATDPSYSDGSIFSYLRDTTGVVYLYQRDSNGIWGSEQKLIASDGAAYDNFGSAVTLQENTLLVGASGDDAKSFDAGAAYFYSRSSDGSWGSEKKLTSSKGVAADFSSIAVTLTGDTLVVGAYGKFAKNGRAAAVYLYHRSSDGNWGRKQKLSTSREAAANFSGRILAHSENTLVLETNSYAIYLYHRGKDGNWGDEQKLAASDGAKGFFGSVVVLSGNTLAVGDHAGVVYLYQRSSDGSWGGEQKLTTSDGVAEDNKLFGAAIAISGETLAVGNPSYLQGNAGTVYLYRRGSDGNWGDEQKLTAKGKDWVYNSFGTVVAFSRDTLAVGASSTDFYGTIYFYHRDSDGNWMPSDFFNKFNVVTGEPFFTGKPLTIDF